MKGKVAVITGALGALGKVVDEGALPRGARVVARGEDKEDQPAA